MSSKKNMSKNEFLDLYKATFQLPTQWGELDLGGHINNVVYMRYFESGRVAYLQKIVENKTFDFTPVGPVLASIEVRYKVPLFFPDTITVGTRVTEMDEYSLIMEAAIWSEQHARITTEAKARLVFYDFRTKQKAPIPQEVVAGIAALDGIEQKIQS
ncbi:acyl-CoA thioesterase [Thermonema rossianum]|uniref:acyl-CoA thioesterase n=1 Tax=Thermonema rossianum TaxID=55505 RepID=UPI00068DC3D7|nr:thioesterase family protein [Thermonema rossianum]